MRGTAIVFFIGLITITQPVNAGHGDMEELLVSAKKDTREFALSDTVGIGADSGQLLRKAPGANLNSNGPLTGIAQYRGMYGSRISTHVDGSVLSSGGPNWMDPPLSYAPAAMLESLVVNRGIAPVSAGQETIGGAVNATTWSRDFTDGEIEISGRMRGGAQSVRNGYLLSGGVVVTNDQHRLKLSRFVEAGDDASFSDGKILTTEYQRQRFDIGYGLRFTDHTLQIDYGRNETGDSGTPALPMDIQFFDSDLFRALYKYDRKQYEVNAKVYYSDIDHGMSNYHLRQAPGNDAMWRRNIATGKNIGFSLVADIKSWKFGIDGHREDHNSNIDNPKHAMFFVKNFNNAERQIIGVFAEYQKSLADNWLLDSGLRYNNVSMDADTVNGTPAMMMPPATMLRNSFNAADRLYDSQNKVSATNSEKTSNAYALLNFQAYWNPNGSIKLGLSIENITDEDYNEHLGGYYRVRGNPDIAVGSSIPGYGRNFSARVDYHW